MIDVRELMSEIFKINEAEVYEMYKQRDAEIDFILRNKIDRPIKGEITKGKLRWRGIKSLVFGPGYKFIGVMQRSEVITVYGVYEPIGYTQ